MRIFFLILFLCIMIAIFVYLGIRGSRRIQNEDDYETARRSYHWVIVGFSLCATFFSGATFLGGAGLMYRWGFPSIWFSFLNPAAAFLGIVYLGKIGNATNNTNARTLPELLGIRFNSEAVRVICALVSFFYIFSVGSQISGGGTLFSHVLGLDYRICLIIITVIVLVYLVIGGAHANITTAATQFIVMLISIGIVAIFLLTFKGAGSFIHISDVLTKIDPYMGGNSLINPGRQLYSTPLLISMIFFAHITVMIQPNYTMKFGALKDKKDTWKMVLLCGCVCIPVSLLAALPGLWTQALGIQLDVNDLALVALLDGRIPDVIFTFVCVGILCAILSTGCGLYLSIAQSVSNDLYRCTIAPRMHHTPEQVEKNQRILTRVFIVVIAVVAMVVVINPPESLTLLLWVGSGGIICTSNGALLLALVWRKVSKKGVIISMCWCLPVFCILIFLLGWDTLAAAGMMFLLEVASIVVFSFIFHDAPSDKYLYEHGLFHNKIDPEKAGVDPAYIEQKPEAEAQAQAEAQAEN